MRAADNHAGFQIEKLTPYGWKTPNFTAPHADRESADAALAVFKASAPDTEWRVMPVLEGRAA